MNKFISFVLSSVLIFAGPNLGTVHAAYEQNSLRETHIIDTNIYWETNEELKEMATDEEMITEVEAEKPEPTTYFHVPLSEDLQNHIFALCEERGVDAAIIMVMIKRESNYTASAIGDNGNSYGLMQIQPRWHQARMERLGCTDLLDPYQNVEVGIDLLGDLLEKDKGIEWALMAYNGGASYANRKVSKGEISNYAAKVLEDSAALVRSELL